jgi:hypothetical protein
MTDQTQPTVLELRRLTELANECRRLLVAELAAWMGVAG